MIEPATDVQDPTLEERVKALRASQSDVGLGPLALAASGIPALWGLARALPAPHLLWIVPTVALLQYRIVISGHEAVHGTLCRSKTLNEALGVLGQALVGVSFTAYRLQHLHHHKARTADEDPDGHIYAFVVATRPGIRRVWRWLAGAVSELWVKVGQKGAGASLDASSDLRSSLRRDSILSVLAQGLIVVSCALVSGVPWGAFILWYFPLLAITFLLNRTRLVIEHGLALDLQGAGGLPSSRIPTIDVVAPAWQRGLLSPYLFNYHCTHHLFMSVPHHALPALHAHLRERNHPGFHVAEGDYLRCLAQVLFGPTRAR